MRMICYSDSSFQTIPTTVPSSGTAYYSSTIHPVLAGFNSAAIKATCFYSSRNEASLKCIVRSVLGGETYALADAFHATYTFFHDMSKMLGRHLELTMLADSLSLFKVLVNASTITQKSWMIFIRAAREAYEKFEIRHVGWVKSPENLADGLTNKGKFQSLEEVLTTDKRDPNVMK